MEQIQKETKSQEETERTSTTSVGGRRKLDPAAADAEYERCGWGQEFEVGEWEVEAAASTGLDAGPECQVCLS